MIVRRIPAGFGLGLALTLLAALGFSITAQAASSISGIVGTWGAKQTTRFTVNGFGTRKVTGDGTCTITDRNNFNAGLFCQSFDVSQGQTYSGGLSPVVRRKKLAWGLDSAGMAQVQANMTNLLVARNLKRGQVLDPANVSYEFRTFQYQPIRLTQSQTKPTVAKVRFTGQAIQIVNGRFIVKPFNYTIKIKFLARAP